MCKSIRALKGILSINEKNALGSRQLFVHQFPLFFLVHTEQKLILIFIHVALEGDLVDLSAHVLEECNLAGFFLGFLGFRINYFLLLGHLNLFVYNVLVLLVHLLYLFLLKMPVDHRWFTFHMLESRIRLCFVFFFEIFIYVFLN